jgi:hypothetical protein
MLRNLSKEACGILRVESLGAKKRAYIKLRGSRVLPLRLESAGNNIIIDEQQSDSKKAWQVPPKKESTNIAIHRRPSQLLADDVDGEPELLGCVYINSNTLS